MAENELTAFVVGAGHSGSTLLGITLGAHSQVFYAGEARKSIFLDDLDKPLKKRACKLCGESCVVWGTLRPSAHPDRDLYDLLSERTNKSIVLDSTKHTEWIEAGVRAVHARGGRVRLFLLQRDGRAVVNSRLRKYPEVSAREHARNWRRQIEASRAFAASFDGPILDVRYERLATAPKEELTRAAALLGVAFEDAMLTPWTSAQHPLGGNNGTQWLMARTAARPGSLLELGERTRAYYESHPRRIVLDLRWRQELSAADLRAFEQEAGEANLPTAWEGA